MPKFLLSATGYVSYSLTIEAPSMNAALDWYEKHSNGDEFDSAPADGWDFNGAVTVSDDCQAFAKVDENGDPIQKGAQ